MSVSSGFFNSLNGDRKYNAVQMLSLIHISGNWCDEECNCYARNCYGSADFGERT